MTMIDRRTALSAGAAGAMSIAATSLLPGIARAAGKRLFDWPPGVQLYSVNAQLDQDFDGTLTKLALLGFKVVEAAGLHGYTPAQFHQAIDKAGLKLVGAHVSMPDLQKDPAGQIATVRDMGASWLICSSPKPDKPLPQGVPWIPAMIDAMTLDAWHENAVWLNRLGAMAKRAGLGFGYHTHPIDFAHYQGRRGFDIFRAHTDPALVKFELDVAWAVAGGADPVSLMKADPGRYRFLHVKGLVSKPPLGHVAHDFATTEVGHGVIDWRAVFAEAHKVGVLDCYIEQEPPYSRPIFESLAIGRDYLKSL
jgi:sugar phosphate isomerase/epimerase